DALEGRLQNILVAENLHCTVVGGAAFLSRGCESSLRRSCWLESFSSMVKRVRLTGERPNSEQNEGTVRQQALLMAMAGFVLARCAMRLPWLSVIGSAMIIPCFAISRSASTARR